MSNKKIRLKVQVKNKGKWNYRTNEMNGYYFAGSGNFSSKDQQIITLTGYGTPQQFGKDRFILKHNGTDISYDVHVLDNQVQFDWIPSYLYFAGKVDGQDIFINPPYTVDNAPNAYSGIDSFSFAAYASGVYPYDPGSGSLGIQKDLLAAPGGIYSEQDFKNFFLPGAYPFGSPNCRLNGITVFWIDQQNELWTTYYGSADQGGSSFKITAIEDGYDSNGGYYVKVFIRFNCKLYHYPTNQMKLLTDGQGVICFKKPR
jgi:hypothetical protein